MSAVKYKRYADSPWTEEKVADLKHLLTGEPLSGSEIAAKLNMSRSAIVSKTRRMGWKLPRDKKQAAAAQSRPESPRSKFYERPATVKTVKRLKVVKHQPVRFEHDEFIEREQPKDENIPLGQRRTLLELTPWKCRWPVGDPGQSDFFFCGAITADAKPYCKHHCAVAFQPLRPMNTYRVAA